MKLKKLQGKKKKPKTKPKLKPKSQADAVLKLPDSVLLGAWEMGSAYEDA
jgi:hypothetical protein